MIRNRYGVALKGVFTAVAVVLLAAMASCYRISVIVQDHDIVCGDKFHTRIVVSRSGESNNGIVHNVHPMLGICVPKGWSVSGDVYVTQIPKSTTDVGSDEYKKPVTRKMNLNADYTRYLNEIYPKSGYEWIGMASDKPILSLFNAENPDIEVDYIYTEVTLQTNDLSGVFYIDYVVGQVDNGKLNDFSKWDYGWSTNATSFSGNRIVKNEDTRVAVRKPDGTIGGDTYSEPETNPDWQLELIPEATRAGTTYAYHDRKYDDLFTRNRGWNGGDGVVTLPLPNGDVFWTFNDSFYGVVNDDDRSRGSSSFPRNSVMLQKAGPDGLPGEDPADFVWLADYVNWRDPNADRYFHCRTHLRHPQGECSLAEIERGDIDQGHLYWSGHGLVRGNKLQWLWIGVNTAGTLENVGNTALAVYNLDGTMPKDYYLPGLPDYLPRKGDYMYMESVDHYMRTDNKAGYGSTLWEDEDGHIYLYCQHGVEMIVARTVGAELTSEWEYYVRDSKQSAFRWQRGYPSDGQLDASSVFVEGGSCMIPWIFKYDDYYYLVTQTPIYGRDVNIYRSEHPWGPFGEKRILMTLPSTIRKIGNQTPMTTYMINLHVALSRQGELVFSTNTEAHNFSDNFNAPGSADWYRPFFYRVFNWESLYGLVPSAGIDDVEADTPSGLNDDNRWFNLQGIEVKNPGRGLYIHQGKKVLLAD